MQKLRLLILLLGCSIFTVQGQPNMEKLWMETFLHAFNEKQYSQIYGEFSPSLKSELTLEKAKEFFEEIQYKMGGIVQINHLDTEQTKFTNGSIGLVLNYKLEFETKDVVLLSMSINTQQEIEGFSLSDYKPKEIDMSFLENTPEQIIKDVAHKLSVNTQLSIAIVQNDQVDYYGVLQQKKGPISIENKTTIFSLGTLGSIFTTTALSAAVLDNKLSYTQKASEFFDFKFHNGVDFLVSELASNVSGIEFNDSLVNTQEALRLYSTTQMLANLATGVTKDTVFGQRFSFLGNAIIADILTKVNQQPFERIITDQIFTSYGMDNSHVLYTKKLKNFAYGYDSNSSKVKPKDFNAFIGASFGYSTIEDVSKFIIAQFNASDKVLSNNRLPSAIVGQDMWIANGWKISFPKDADTKVYHNIGFSEGFYNYIAFDPINKKAVIFFLNAANPQGAEVLEELSYKLTAKIFK